jgi:hypothetical protein
MTEAFRTRAGIGVAGETLHNVPDPTPHFTCFRCGDRDCAKHSQGRIVTAQLGRVW